MTQRFFSLTERRSRAALATVALTGVAAVAATASADSPPAGEAAAKAAAITARADQTVNTLLARGSVLNAKDIDRLKASPALTSGNGDLARARAIDAPAGADKSQPWYVVPSSDASGRVCLDAGEIGVACGSADLLATKGIGSARISNSNPEAGPWSPGGTATFAGIVPPDVAEVVALTPGGEALTQVRVSGQAYQLDVATDKLGSIELRDASGQSLGATRIK